MSRAARFVVSSVFTGWLTLIGSVLIAAEIVSHPPVRPLPQANDRPRDASPAKFVDPVRGDDAHDGSEARPWRSVQKGAEQLVAGDTLYLRGGVYYEHVVVTRGGTLDRPITIRAYPGEVAVLDGGLREFAERPDQCWEPCPDGVQGEFQSRQTYPGLGGDAEHANVFGLFADSYLPLQGYLAHRDLRSDNPYWNLDDKQSKSQSIYCGPGIYYDIATERIYCRLAHTTLKCLGSDNYRGETDPRKVPLVIAGHRGGATLTLRGTHDVRLQDLVVRGAREATLSVEDSQRISLDGLSVYGGSAAVRVRDTHGLRMQHCVCRGLAAPWTFRTNLKYRSVEARIFSATGWEPTGNDNRDFELTHNEFTDCVDGVFIGNVQHLHFSSNLVDNVSDDGVFLTAGTGFDGQTPGGGATITNNLFRRCLTTFAFGVGHGRQKTIASGKQTGPTVTIADNVFDLRGPVMYHQPHSAEEDTQLRDYGRLLGDHGSPAWEPLTFESNTVVMAEGPFRGAALHGLSSAVAAGTQRRVFNNLFLQMNGAPGTAWPERAVPTIDKQAASQGFPLQLYADWNGHWSLNYEAGGDFLARLRQPRKYSESGQVTPPPWGEHDRYEDPQLMRVPTDWRVPLDVRLAKDSPARGKGVIASATQGVGPHSTSRSVGALAGALPDESRVGVQGRYTIGGALAATPATAPLRALTPWREPSEPPMHARGALIVQGYPAFDAEIWAYVLRKQHAPVELVEKTWVKPGEFKPYQVVALLGDFKRAKIEPNTFDAAEIKALRAYCEAGGTLVVGRGNGALFTQTAGREWWIEVTGGGRLERDPIVELKQPQHAWLKHLASNVERPWLNTKVHQLLPAVKGESLIGSRGGSSLWRARVGAGQVIYLGWDVASSLPNGRLKSAVEQEDRLEEQVAIIDQICREIFATVR